MKCTFDQRSVGYAHRDATHQLVVDFGDARRTVRVCVECHSAARPSLADRLLKALDDHQRVYGRAIPAFVVTRSQQRDLLSTMQQREHLHAITLHNGDGGFTLYGVPVVVDEPTVTP